jgi:glycosyltransferase involved in cell wall biosynthesis
MFLSIVIPTWNRRASLQVTLDGLARQDYPCSQFEVLVVSDGSADGTDEFVRGYAAHVPYALFLLTQSNAGPARARNRGIEAAQGEIVVFLDDDVEPCPHFLSAHARHHERRENTVVIGPLSPDPAAARREPPWIAWEHAMLQKQYVGWATGFFTEVNPGNFYSGNASVRRAQLLAVGGYDEAFTRQEDVELACRLQRQFHPDFVFDPEADALHRPRRSWASWLAVPLAYGRLDVVRARRGDASWDVVREGYHARKRATQTLARVTWAVPCVAAPLRGLLRLAAVAAHRLGRVHTGFAALSVIYNLRYLDGAASEMGRRGLMDLLLPRGESAQEAPALH